MSITNANGAMTLRQPRVRDYLSFSAVSTFQSCPLRYYFKYVAGLPEAVVSASLLFGRALHSSVQYHFEQLLAGNPVPDMDTLIAVYHNNWLVGDDQEVRFAKGEDENTLGKLADRMLWSFQESDFAHPEGTIIGIEEELRGELVPGLPDLLARVDLLVDTPEALVVSDFKTSRRCWSEDQVADAASQLLLYSELAQTLADGKPLRLEFAVLTKTKSPELTVHSVGSEEREVERTKRVVEEVWKAIQAQHFYPNPSALNCPTCPFRVSCRQWIG